MSISTNLKKFREEQNLSQAQLAEKASVSQAMIAQIERGSKSPTITLAFELAKALDVEFTELVK